MLLVSKICSAVLLALLRLLAGLLPLKVYRKLEKWGRSDPERRKRIDLFLSIFLCFGAGLLFSTCFIHMIPEVRDSFTRASRVGEWPLLMQFPFAETVICLGFFVVYLLEELGERFMVNDHDTKEEKKHQQTKNLDDPKSQALLTKENGDVSQSHHHQSSDEEGHHHHGHSHGPVLSDQHSVTAAIRGFLLVAALSFHSIFEGMAIGLQSTLNDVWFLFTAVIVHELAIMFCIGMEMLASKIRVVIYIVYMVELGTITSVGVAAGILVTEYVQDPTAGHLLAIAILQGIAAGTLLFVTFLEVIERERRKPGHGLVKFFAIFIGFILLSGMEALGGHQTLGNTQGLFNSTEPYHLETTWGHSHHHTFSSPILGRSD